MYALLLVNGFLVAGILSETAYLFSRACIERTFMQDSKFLKTHLGGRQKTISLTERLQEREFQEFIERTKEIIFQETQKLLELESPFSRNLGDDTTAENLTLDHIYTNLEVIQYAETYDFSENREEQLNLYLRSPDENSQPKTLEDLLNVESKKILIIGKPGIGKTLFCIKLFRDWALNKISKATSDARIHYDAAFFVKFRRFNRVEDLSLRELLIQSEYFPTRYMDDGAWNHLLKNPESVLIVFDGFDEFKHGENIPAAATYPRSIEEKQPLQILYRWLVTGVLLREASIVTTTRPTALSGIRHLKFDKTFEIVRFSTEQIVKCECSDSVTLPSKLTTIYENAVKVFYLRHTKEFRDIHFTREDFLSGDLPSDVEKKFEKLGRVAFEGIEEGKLILGGNEVRGLEESAFLHRLPNRLTAPLEDEKQFCFIHLTIQEFFAARYLTKNMREIELRNFVSWNIKNDKWKLVFQFLAGLMEDKNHLSSKIITDLFPVKTEENESADYNEQWTENEEKRKVICWPTEDEKDLAVTLINCINENSGMKLEAQRKLQQINFNCANFISCHLTAVACASLVNVIYVQQISLLDLSFNNIGSLGCFEICKLLKCKESQLSWLNLANNELTDEAAKCLAEAINNNNCQLNTLNLWGNNILDIGAQHLAEAIDNDNNCQLRTLNLSENNISDIGAQHLAEAINNIHCQLGTLDLSLNNISAIGAQHLAEAMKDNNCQLRTLNLLIYLQKIPDL